MRLGPRGFADQVQLLRSTGRSHFGLGNPTCSSCSVVYSLLSLSLSLAACSPPSPYRVLELVFRVSQRAGCRAVVGPCRPRIKGPLHARSPGPQMIFRPHVTYPLMQSSDAVVGYSSVAVDVSLVVVVSSCPIIITVSPEMNTLLYI